MPFSIRPFRRFPVQCAVYYNAGPFRDKVRSGISREPGDVSLGRGQGTHAPCTPNHQMSQSTESSIHIRNHATTDTPDLHVDALIAAEVRYAIEEAHRERVVRNL
jgi:hypothetical protein